MAAAQAPSMSASKTKTVSAVMLGGKSRRRTESAHYDQQRHWRDPSHSPFQDFVFHK
jgi:hypothetical protein